MRERDLRPTKWLSCQSGSEALQVRLRERNIAGGNPFKALNVKRVLSMGVSRSMFGHDCEGVSVQEVNRLSIDELS